jgi:hypothetical protein
MKMKQVIAAAQFEKKDAGPKSFATAVLAVQAKLAAMKETPPAVSNTVANSTSTAPAAPPAVVAAATVVAGTTGATTGKPPHVTVTKKGIATTPASAPAVTPTKQKPQAAPVVSLQTSLGDEMPPDDVIPVPGMSSASWKKKKR